MQSFNPLPTSKFSKAAFRNLKHKTKKSLMLRIGRTESQPEDPKFKYLLSSLSELKKQLREMYNTSRSVAASGNQMNENLEKFCGFGLRSEEIFTKEADFINILEDRVCTALGRIVRKDLNTLFEVTVRYKTAKLKFDALHFRTVKQLRKQNQTGTIDHDDEVMQANDDLPALKEAYLDAKAQVRLQSDTILTHLKTKVEERLEELQAASDAQHHQLYCRYIKERLSKIVQICSEEANEEVSNLIESKSVSGENVAGNQEAISFLEDSERTEDIKNAEHELFEATGNGPCVSTSHDKNVAATLVAEKHQQNPSDIHQIQNEISPGVQASEKQIMEGLAT